MTNIKNIWKTKREIFCLGKINESIDCGWASTKESNFEDWENIYYEDNKLFGLCGNCLKKKPIDEKKAKLKPIK